MANIDGPDSQVRSALRQLGHDPIAQNWSGRLLAGGLSGSAVHLVQHNGRSSVLKLTMPDASPELMARAEREIWFYRDLAALVPVQVPDLLGFCINAAEGAILHLAACTASPAPDEWSTPDYTQIATQLGHLHARLWNASTAAFPSWMRVRTEVPTAQCQRAAQLWRSLVSQDDPAERSTRYRHQPADLALRVPSLDPQLATMATTLCHGDFHQANLLRGTDGEWVWADWQEVRIGHGVDDLAFFWQRAFTATTTPPPYPAMVQAYRLGLESHGIQLDWEAFDRALAWSELRSWLIDWPPYLGYLTPPTIDQVRLRIDRLTDRLDLS